MALHIYYTIAIYLLILSTTAFAINCPQNCKCAWALDSLEVDCSYSGLIDTPDFRDLPIEKLDLSGNHFVLFPAQLADIRTIQYLDLSNNQIDYLGPDDLFGFYALNTLLLANNSLTSWENLNPSKSLMSANNLQRLSLSGNQLGSFNDFVPQQILVSESLTDLELENCGFELVKGERLLVGLPNLRRLALSGNPLKTAPLLTSLSLRELELRNCKLQQVAAVVLKGLPHIEAFNLSWNTAVQLDDAGIASNSLKRLDLSFCNLDDINLNGLPSLTNLNLKGNMLRMIDVNSFANNTQLEVIDLSRNSLRLIDGETFAGLSHLTRLDLSYNEIAHLNRNTFRQNEALISLNLSRNILEKFTKLVSSSLREVSFSWCEIMSIDTSAFTGLTAIESLDLSHTLIKEFPAGMRSPTLLKLVLSNCKLSALRNNTFRDFPELRSLYLNGNRFTNPFKAEIFRGNKHLDDIWIGDNPWLCNCHDPTFVDFYEFLTAKPQKLKDKHNVLCASPPGFYGKTWENACTYVWSSSGRSSNAEHVWTTIMLSIVVIGALIFCFTCFQKYMNKRREREDHREYRTNQEEMMEIRRQNQRMLDSEGTPNAPAPHETNLPTYEDAIRMPKLERPVKSMLDLTASARARKKLQRNHTDPEEEENGLVMDNNRQRFRSEEMLSNRDKERTAYIDPSRRTGYVPYNNSGSRRFSIEDSRFPAAILKSQNLQSAEQIANFQSYENSPYTKRRTKIADIPPFRRATLQANSIEFLTDPEFETNSKPGSPFAKRKPKRSVTQVQPTDSGLYANLPSDRLDPPDENYFGAARKTSNPSSVEDSDFQVVQEPDMASFSDGDCSSASDTEMDLERGKRRKRKNSTNRRASGNFSAAAAAAEDSSSSDREPIVVVHKAMKETLF